MTEGLVRVGETVRRPRIAESGLPPISAVAAHPDPAGMPPSTMGPATFVGHMDICPENVVFRDGQAPALIDFDLARPTNRLREVCNMLLWWAPLMPAQDREAAVRDVDVFARVALMVRAYGLVQADRALIVQAMLNSTERTWHAMRHRAGQRGGPWRRLWDQGLGERLTRRQQWLRDHLIELHEAAIS